MSLRFKITDIHTIEDFYFDQPDKFQLFKMDESEVLELFVDLARAKVFLRTLPKHTYYEPQDFEFVMEFLARSGEFSLNIYDIDVKFTIDVMGRVEILSPADNQESLIEELSNSGEQYEIIVG